MFVRRRDAYRDFFSRHSQPMWAYALGSLRFVEVNDAACVAYGYSREAFLKLTLGDIATREDRDEQIAFARDFRPDSGPSTTLWRHRRSDGSVFYADVTSNASTFRGKPVRLALALDATARLAVSRALSESRSALGEAQELAHLGSFDADLTSGEIRWSAELYRIFGVDPAREAPSDLYAFDHPADALWVAREIARARRERTAFTVEHRIVTRDGRERFVYERGRFFYDDTSSEPCRVIGAVLDITERKRAEERLRHLAERDPLTGLLNRTRLRERLVDATERARAEGRKIGVLFIDLDRFKAINDTIAHAAGDRVLRELGCRLEASLEGRGIVARPGGDEFIIILDPLESEAEGAGTARDLLAAIVDPVPHDSTHLTVTASVGLAMFPRDGATPDDLLRSADAAMYAAKAGGGNAHETYSPELHATALAQLELERSLRGALDREAIDVAYQPIVDAATGNVVAFEALARWTENGRIVEPNLFIPLAEEMGLIVRLGTFVLDRACREACRLIAAGHAGLTMCVNISARQFREPDFIGRIQRALVQSGLAAARLQLEITESAYLSGDTGLRNVEALHDLGVQLSIDDFGTGYSSLGYLKRLPVHALKIDRSFVAEILSDSADQAIVRAIIAVAKNLGLTVIAEGVETAEQAAMLRALGCTQLQGYLYARPLPSGALADYLGRATTHAAQKCVDGATRTQA